MSEWGSDPAVSSSSRIAAPDDLEWALDRVRKLFAVYYVNASRFGSKLLKGFGYPDEVLSNAADARALATVLAQVETLTAALREAEATRAQLRQHVDRALGDAVMARELIEHPARREGPRNERR